MLRPGTAYFPRATQVLADTAMLHNGNKFPIGAAVHAVRFDAELDAWVADIELRSGGIDALTEHAYMPFVRLALARYQPHALRIADIDLGFSEATLLDPVQTLPTRRFTVRHDVNNRCALRSGSKAPPTGAAARTMASSFLSSTRSRSSCNAAFPGSTTTCSAGSPFQRRSTRCPSRRPPALAPTRPCSGTAPAPGLRETTPTA